MAVRRKSNWYIYFIAFGVALAFAVGVIFTFSWYLFPEEKGHNTGLTSTGELADNFKPDASHNFNLLTMLTDGEHDSPDLFIMVSFNAVENRLVLIPLHNGISMGSTGRTLPNVYAAQGGQGAISAVKAVTGVECDAYWCIGRDAFIRMMSACGNVEYNVPKTLVISDGTVMDTFNTGEQMFSAESAFRYIYLADFGEGEEYRFNMVCDLLCSLINQNIYNIDSSLLDTVFNIVSTTSDTDITGGLFDTRKAALLNTATYGSSPAEYYVPYGEVGGDGSFTIAENSLISISQKCGTD